VPGTKRLAAALVVGVLALLLATQVTASDSSTSEGSGAATDAASAAGVASTSRVVAAARVARSRSKIVKTNRGWSCTRPLSRIARRHGRGLPLLVKITFTRQVNISPGVIDIQHGCRGDGNSNTIDLILKVQGNGRTKGGTFDAIKVHHDPHDIQITGYANCGPRNSIGHQDGAQIMGGNTIDFISFTWGKWKKRKATCQGAAGTFAPGTVGGYPVRNIACIRCRSVSCNHGMSIGEAAGTVVRNSRWRSDNPADRRGMLATGLRGICEHGGPPCVVLPTSSQNHIVGNRCDRWPYRHH
jgi:hypothetical protein